MATEIHEGGCGCGAIRYRAVGEPNSTNTCACSQCTRQTGAPLGAFASFPLDRFEILSGEPASYRSSDFAVRQFCPACGSALFWRRDGSAELDVFIGTLDRPDAVPPPTEELWVGRRVSWLAPVAGAKQWPEGRT
jgi:hypothetical protein